MVELSTKMRYYAFWIPENPKLNLKDIHGRTRENGVMYFSYTDENNGLCKIFFCRNFMRLYVYITELDQSLIITKET